MKIYKNLVKYSLLALVAIFFVFGLTNVVRADSSCNIPSQSGRIIVNFGSETRIYSDRGLASSYTSASANIPAGTYKVTLYGYDGYSDRVNVTQPNEKFYLRLMSGGPIGTLVASSNSTSDLPDRVAYAQVNQVVNTALNISSRIDNVVAYHSVFPDTSSPNSIVPGCAAFDPISTTPPPTAINGSCAVTHYSCNAGSLGYTAEYSTGWQWWCNGNTNTPNTEAAGNVLCTENKSVTPTPNNLTVSCTVDDSSVDVDEDVTYTASASGGSGSYSYNWSGSESLSGSSRSVTWSYDDDGTKNARVTVTSGSQSGSASCSVRVREDEEDDDDLEVRCYANPSNPQIGERMNWYVNVSGGDGDYDYEWDGSENLNSSSRSPSMTYYNGGRKNATVEVRSNGQTESATCYANVDQNTVLAFTQSNPIPLEGAVYLNQVPYTGLADNLKLVWFVLGLAFFSAYIAYVVISYKKSVGELK